VRDLPDCLGPLDLLVVNDTRVRNARLIGKRRSGAAVEVLLLERSPAGVWQALVQPAARLKPGEEVELEGGALLARMLERGRDAAGRLAEWRLELFDATGRAADEGAVEEFGRVPLPPYIRRAGSEARPADRRDYQTIFARELGAAAAPTAGLHFTDELLARLERAGIERRALTLHVGAGTFRPVTALDTDEHRMHAEHYVLPTATARAVEGCRARGGRVVCVGTTSARVLESCASDGGVTAGRGSTDLFITPGFRFRAMDGILTNFHLPQSTLLMLVSAFAGRERTLSLYREAIELEYRFYSYGDAMLLLP
jgi:S-adenosylmethionine:tRNA ribosyltransferase-isomerase